MDFARIKALPPYVFNVTNQLKQQALARGEDVIDFSMGNPDQATPPHIVDKLLEAAKDSKNHRYSMSRGILAIRQALCDWYARRFDVSIDPEHETILTLGSKEGLAHLALAIAAPGDGVLVPTPCYPIHRYGFILAGANIVEVAYPQCAEEEFAERFCQNIIDKLENLSPKIKFLVLNFPANPTTDCVNLDFFTQIIEIAKRYDLYVIHDFAYAELSFDGYRPPSILQVPGAKEYAVESYSLSKGYNMPGWRVGFVSGNRELVAALAHLKSYLDYGMFAPIEHAAIEALATEPETISPIKQMYQNRRDCLCDGLEQLGWPVKKPKATMFVWAKIPEVFQSLGYGSLAFSQYLIEKAQVAVSPGIGFGESSDDYVRFALIENEQRINQALDNLRPIFAAQGLGGPAGDFASPAGEN